MGICMKKCNSFGKNNKRNKETRTRQRKHSGGKVKPKDNVKLLKRREERREEGRGEGRGLGRSGYDLKAETKEPLGKVSRVSKKDNQEVTAPP